MKTAWWRKLEQAFSLNARMAKARMAKAWIAKDRMAKARIAKARMAKDRMAKDRISQGVCLLLQGSPTVYLPMHRGQTCLR